jgi:hypothetical protein
LGHSRSRPLATRHEHRSGRTATLSRARARPLAAPSGLAQLPGSPADTDRARSP